MVASQGSFTGGGPVVASQGSFTGGGSVVVVSLSFCEGLSVCSVGKSVLSGDCTGGDSPDAKGVLSVASLVGAAGLSSIFGSDSTFFSEFLEAVFSSSSCGASVPSPILFTGCLAGGSASSLLETWFTVFRSVTSTPSMSVCECVALGASDALSSVATMLADWLFSSDPSPPPLLSRAG